MRLEADAPEPVPEPASGTEPPRGSGPARPGAHRAAVPRRTAYPYPAAPSPSWAMSATRRRTSAVARLTLDDLRRTAAHLFAPVPLSAVSRWSVAGAAAAIGALATYSLLRVGGPGAFDSIWAEDGANFLSDAYLLPVWQTIFRPLNGYFLVLPRLFTALAAAFPVTWGPAVLSSVAALSSGAIAVMVYVASGNLLPSRLARCVAAGWVVAAPLAESTHTFGPNMVAPLQFVELYGLFWALLWTPVRGSARVVQVAFVTMCGLSTFLGVLLLPLLLLRCWAVRTRLTVALAVSMAATAVVQTAGLVFGLTTRVGISHPRIDPLWALLNYVRWGLPFGMVGENTMRDSGFVEPGVHSGGGGPWYWLGVVVTWVVVVAVLGAAWRRLTQPAWLFTVVAGGQSIAILCGQIMIQGRLELRYAYTPSLLAVAALVALLLPHEVPRHGRRQRWLTARLPLSVLIAALALAAVVSYRTPTMRSVATPWHLVVAQATQSCREQPLSPFVVTYSVTNWFVVIPCHRLG